MSTIDDLATLSELDEDTILTELRKRYGVDVVYTYIGDILIAVNPYKTLAIYGADLQDKYREIGVRSCLPPHIFAVSDAAYHNMLRNVSNQCCVVSGESGAGKTESTKLLIQHIAHLCCHDTTSLHNQIVQVNPMMEAFGNARTVLNDNSSRFGKFIELTFDSKGQLKGAKITEYLLEKSRVITQGVGERNFHVFYYLLAGLDENRKKANMMKKPEEHRIIRNVDGRPVFESKAEMELCKAEWNTLMEVMETMGFSSQDNGHVTVDGILAVLAAILHIADIEFIADPATDGVYLAKDDSLELAAQLLAVDSEKLMEALISTKSSVGGADETVVSMKTVAQANDGRDALAKALYGRLFSWIIYHINLQLDRKQAESKSTTTKIGILDIYGFENFTNNSFEQLCINITNEQLQCFFNEHIFRSELEEYEREGISKSDITYTDNKRLLDFFLETSKPSGLFSLLDDESRRPGGSDTGFIENLTTAFPSLPDFKKSRGYPLIFVIQHFAGQVTYSADGFVEKNRDTLSDNILQCMKKSEAQLVYELFSPVSDFGQLRPEQLSVKRRFNRKSRLFLQMPDLSQKTCSNDVMKRLSRMNGLTAGPAGARPPARSKPSMSPIYETGSVKRNLMPKTLGAQFKSSLDSLMTELKTAQPHFIRCVKPNVNKACNSFNSAMVVEQLRYTGVLETVRIRKQGYPTRLLFIDFIQRYRYVTFKTLKELKPNGSCCDQLLFSVGLKDYQIGRTKVFLKYFHVEQLNVKLKDFAQKIAICQKFVRGFYARRKYSQLLKTAQESASQMRNLANYVRNINAATLNAQQLLRAQDLAKTLPAASSPENVYDLPDLGEMNAGDQDSIALILLDTLPKLSNVDRRLWAKVYVIQKAFMCGKFFIKISQTTIDNSECAYQNTVCGLKKLCSGTGGHDAEIRDAMEKVGQGVKIIREQDSSISIMKMTSADVTVRLSDKRAYSTEIIACQGILAHQNKPVKVFDMSAFKRRIGEQIQRSKRCDRQNLVELSVMSFSIGKNCACDTDTPLWFIVINLAALDLLGDDRAIEEILSSNSIKLSPHEATAIRRDWQSLHFNRRVRSQT